MELSWTQPTVLGQWAAGLPGPGAGGTGTRSLLEGPLKGRVHSGDGSQAGDIGHFHAASEILGELQPGADGHTLGRSVDVAPIISAQEVVGHSSWELEPSLTTSSSLSFTCAIYWAAMEPCYQGLTRTVPIV